MEPVRPSRPDGDTTTFERALSRACQVLMRAKRQITIPRGPLRDAGIWVGDRMRVTADGPGRLVFERIDERAAGE